MTSRSDSFSGLPFGEYRKVLDHGFISLVDVMGDDEAVVSAARVSYNPAGCGAKNKSRSSRGLIRYLMRHWHTSPFEMCEIKLHVKMPIFVARQWVRHRTASINEVSGRYSVMPREYYTPERVCVQSKDNKQGRGEEVSKLQKATVQCLLRRDADQCRRTYDTLLDDYNLSREVARIGLPVSQYTEWYWKIDLHNLLHFLKLRLHPHAQYEIRLYAEEIAYIVEKWVPLVWEAFEDYRLGSVTFSRGEMQEIKRLILEGSPDDWEAYGELASARIGGSKREAREFMRRIRDE